MRSLKTIPALTLAASLALAACSATSPTEAAGPPPGASGKISPEMVGSVSPVPAFMGRGEHFKIEIQSEGGPSPDGMRHRVQLLWGMGTRVAEGTLMYRNAPGPSRGAPIALDGTVDTAEGKKTIHVEILTEPCTDDAGLVNPQRVTLLVEGETRMRGCGELAVY